MPLRLNLMVEMRPPLRNTQAGPEEGTATNVPF